MILGKTRLILFAMPADAILYSTFNSVTGVQFKKKKKLSVCYFIVQELCESRGGRPGLSVLTSLLVSVDVKIY